MAHGLQEGQGFDIAHRAAHLANRHFYRIRRAHACAALDKFLNLVGDMRNHLHGFAQVVAPALFFQHALVDAPGGEVVGLLHAGFNKALVVSQVQVGFRTVVGHEDLTVLDGAHRAGVHVDIGVKFDKRDLEATRFQQSGQRGRSDALAQ